MKEAPLHDLYPAYVTHTLREAIKAFERRMPGFISPGTKLITSVIVYLTDHFLSILFTVMLNPDHHTAINHSTQTTFPHKYVIREELISVLFSFCSPVVSNCHMF